MLTAVIFNETDAGITYYVVPKDVTRFHGIYVNSSGDKQTESDLADIINNGDWDSCKCDIEEIRGAILANDASLIECGWVH